MTNLFLTMTSLIDVPLIFSLFKIAIYANTCAEWMVSALAAFQHSLAVVTVYANLVLELCVLCVACGVVRCVACIGVFAAGRGRCDARYQPNRGPCSYRGPRPVVQTGVRPAKVFLRN